MHVISVKGLKFTHGLNPIFDGADFSVSTGTKVGLVGPNGAGKSTLLNILIGLETPREGKLQIHGEVSLVPQEVKYDPAMEKSVSVRDYLDTSKTKQDYELRTILTGLELEGLELESSPKNLSGGQKTKLALARSLVAQPDILLLDEPTNYLDVTGKKWVMDFLATYPKTLILVSHDLELLDKRIGKVLAINTHTKKIDQYSGNYSKYLKLKKQQDDLLKRQVAYETKHIKRMEESMKILYKYKSKKGVRQRVILSRRIERAKENLPQLPPDLRRIVLNLPNPDPMGEVAIEAIGLIKSFESNLVLDGVDLVIQRGQKISLIGPNGSGKSTLIKILMGLLKPDSGQIMKDDRLKIGYYSQESDTLNRSQSLLEIIMDASRLNETGARSLLARFLFPGDRVLQKVETLSGGEKTRLAIAKLLLQPYNLLILDEPTTYLDVLSQRIILEGLKTYQGAVLIVSHTEEFIRELNPDKYLLLPENKFDFWQPEILERVGEI